MEPHEVDAIIRQLLQITVHQDAINADLRLSIRQQGDINERLTAAIERLDTTQARIETLLTRVMRNDEAGNGREA